MRLSHPVEEVCHRFVVVCLGFEGPPVDRLGELLLRSWSGGEVATLSEDLLLVNVGVVAGHLVSVRLVCFSLQAGSASAGELCQTARCHMGRRSTAQIEVHHPLSLCQGGEPLGAPLASVVGGLVTDLDSHGLVALVCFSLDGQGAAAPP